MALINCPECGQEGISDSAVACPNCGFDIRGWHQRLAAEEKEKIDAEKAEANLKAQAEKEEAERQRIMDSIAEPNMYGKVWVYPVVLIAGIILAIASGPFWIIAAIIGGAAYYVYSNREYKKFLENPEAFKFNKASTMAENNLTRNSAEVIQPTTTTDDGIIFCPNCGSENVKKQVFQENRGSETITRTKSKYKEQGHGCLWWLMIGWWWWFVDLCLWIVAFFPRLILRLFAAPFKKKKYKGSSTSVTKTVNDISYRTVCTCQKCGHTWSF